MNKNKFLINRAINEFKMGWSLTKLPEQLEKLENNKYVKIFKIIGGLCIFLIVSGISRQFKKLTFYIILTFSFLYSVYRLILVLYIIKSFIINVYSGKLLVRNSPLNSFNTIFRLLGTVSKSTINFTVGTGISYCLCYELDEILMSEGKEAYFVPGMRNIVNKIGAEQLAKDFLSRAGIKDRLSSPRSITDLLNSMSDEEKALYAKETGSSWEDLYKAQKYLQENLNNSDVNNTNPISNILKEKIENENPFNTNK
jgi:hypothetical protein